MQGLIVVAGIVGVALVAGLIYRAEQKRYQVNTRGIILVTGASSGIGRDVAEHLAKNFNFVVLAGARKESDYQNILEDNKSLTPLMVDVASHESCVEAVKKIVELSEKYNLPFVGLVNNAGVGGNYSPLEFQDIKFVKSMFNTNVFGLLELTQLVLPLLRQSNGRVVNLSSLSGLFAAPLSGAYAASKFAVEALSDSLRREVAHHNVSVSVVEPGYVKTRIIETAVQTNQETNPEMLAAYPRATLALRQTLVDMMNSMPGPEETTTPAIVHALTSPYPKTRYLVAQADGLDARVIAWVSWALSDRLKDSIFK